MIRRYIPDVLEIRLIRSKNRLSFTIGILSHTTTYEYDAMNRRTAVIDANGHRTETEYNRRGDVIAVTNPNA